MLYKSGVNFDNVEDVSVDGNSNHNIAFGNDNIHFFSIEKCINVKDNKVYNLNVKGEKEKILPYANKVQYLIRFVCIQTFKQ